MKYISFGVYALVVGFILTPALTFAVTLDANDEDVIVVPITITTEGSSTCVEDADCDGINDTDELTILQTDPQNPDIDGDGFTDGDEVTNGYSPVGEGLIFEIPGDSDEVIAGETQTFTIVAEIHGGDESTSFVAIDFEKQAKLLAKLEKLEARLETLEAKAVQVQENIQQWSEKDTKKSAKKIAKLEIRLENIGARIEKVTAKIEKIQAQLTPFSGGVVVEGITTGISTGGFVIE